MKNRDLEIRLQTLDDIGTEYNQATSEIKRMRAFNHIIHEMKQLTSEVSQLQEAQQK